MNLTPKGFKKYDPTSDGTSKVGQYILDDSSYNMDLADKLITDVENKVDNKVTLNGESKKNLNFTLSDVVQDGLVIKTNTIGNVQTGNLLSLEFYDILFDFKLTQSIPVNQRIITLMSGGGVNIQTNGLNTGFVIVFLKPDNTTGYSYINDVDLKRRNTLRLVRVSNKLNVYVNGLKVTTLIDGIDFKISSNATYITLQNFYDSILSLIYNRQLTPTEITHNFSALNNSDAIKSLEATDDKGNKTNLLFQSDTSHVSTPTGHTDEERYTELAKAMSKEFVSATGADISVANGIGKQRVLGMEMTGQTVKNYADTYTASAIDLSGSPSNLTQVIGNVCSITGKPDGGANEFL